jgi:excisionase family DNA binding protein
MAKSGEIPNFKVGERYLFNADSVRKWMKAKESS